MMSLFRRIISAVKGPVPPVTAFLGNRISVVSLAALPLFVLALFFVPDAVAFAGSCDFPGGDFGECIGSAMGKFVASIFLAFTALFAAVLGYVGVFFNFSMLITVFQFSNFFGNTDGLRLAWGILRDIANIVLLFGFIAIGIQTILDINHFDVGKALPRLIIFAILLNFSLFIAEAVVDISNSVAGTFYAQAGGIDCSSTENILDCSNQGIAGKVMELSGLSAIFNIEEGGEGSFQDMLSTIWNSDTGVAMAVVQFGVLALLIATIGVFFAGGVLLVSRAITLVIVFVTSPIGFAGMAIPGLQSYADLWWRKLTQNALYAPVFVLLMLVSIKIIEGIKGSFGIPANASFYAILAGNDIADIGGVLVLFALVVGFMVAAILSAKEFSILYAGKVVDGTMKWAANTAGGIGLLPFNFAGRKAGEIYDKNVKRISRIPVLGGVVAGALVATGADSVVRGTTGFFAEAKLPTYQTQTMKEAAEERKKRVEEISKGAAENVSKGSLGNKLQGAVAKATSGRGDTDALEVLVNGTSWSKLKETDQVKKGSKGIAEMAVVMSPSKFKEAMKDESVPEGVKKVMRDARFGDRRDRSGRPQGLRALIKDAANPTSATRGISRAQLSKWSASDFEESGVLDDGDYRAKAVQVMTDNQYESVQKSDVIGSNAKKNLEKLRDDVETEGGRFHEDNVLQTLDIINKPAARANISPSVLTKPHVMVHLDPADFSALRRGNKLNDEQRGTMSDYLREAATDVDHPLHDDLIAYANSIHSSSPKAWQEFKNFYNLRGVAGLP